jgi:hypothetical protein
MAFPESFDHQISKFCWSALQSLLIRPANFAGCFGLETRKLETFTEGCIPKTFLIREIPKVLAFSALIVRFVT